VSHRVRSNVALAAFVLGTTLASVAGAQQAAGAPADAAQRVRIQPPWRMSVRADNDAFNFWRGITDRPDKEYTNGDQVAMELAGAPWWGKRFAKRRAPCNGTEVPGARCLTTLLSIGQDMYTPKPGHEPGVVPDWQNDRPYAAWLYAGAEARVASERSLRTVGLELGVTGAPAFGEFAQRTAHKLTGVYSREPIGWNTQVGFEPGVVLTGRNAGWFAARTSSGSVVADIVPHVGASLGNVLTEGEAGFQSRVGLHLSSPWWTSGWRSRAPIALYLYGAARGEAVAHNITLDGNTLGADRRVDRVPLVGEYSLGVGGRFRGIVAEWRAITRSREYETGPSAHAYSTLFMSYEVAARGR
jgi:lipid A 3-O-deacylase